MATGRIRRSAQRGLAVAVLDWLGVAAFAVFMAPSASAAPAETVEIMNFTPPVKSVDKGGTITFTYRIVPQAGLAAAVANQVVNTVAASLPPAPVNVPYVVETLVPLPTLPGANLPQLPQVTIPVPNLPGGTPTPDANLPAPDGTTVPPPAGSPGGPGGVEGV